MLSPLCKLPSRLPRIFLQPSTSQHLFFSTTSSPSPSPTTTKSKPISSPLSHLILEKSKPTPTPLLLKHMYYFANNGGPAQHLLNAQFLQRELPLRLAQRAVELSVLPYGLNETAGVLSVRDVYCNFCTSIAGCDSPVDQKSKLKFAEELRKMQLSRTSVPHQIHLGLQSLINNNGNEDSTKKKLTSKQLSILDRHLNTFFTSRIGIRFLIEHHLQCENDVLHQTSNNTLTLPHGKVKLGLIDPTFNPYTELKNVTDKLRTKTIKKYGRCPEFKIVVPNLVSSTTKNSKKNVKRKHTFTYVPTHFRYIVTEVLKNAITATFKNAEAEAEAQGEAEVQVGEKKDESEGAGESAGKGEVEEVVDGSKDVEAASTLPSITIVVAFGSSDCTIKISDGAGGIPRSLLPLIWTYAHSRLLESRQATKSRSKISSTSSSKTSANTNTSKNMSKKSAGEGKDVVMAETLYATPGLSEPHISGFGLPLARTYARYFGGELTVKSMEGYGVDIYLHLPMLGDACENLPERVERSPGNMVSSGDSGGVEDEWTEFEKLTSRGKEYEDDDEEDYE